MAELDSTDRQRIQRGLMRYWSDSNEVVDGTKAELLTTVNETDEWQNDNQANFKNALTYSSNYTASQLALISCCVAVMRYTPTDTKLLKRLLGMEVD